MFSASRLAVIVKEPLIDKAKGTTALTKEYVIKPAPVATYVSIEVEVALFSGTDRVPVPFFPVIGGVVQSVIAASARNE